MQAERLNLLWADIAIPHAIATRSRTPPQVEERYGQSDRQAREQQQAVTFGVYQLQDRVRECTELYAEPFCFGKNRRGAGLRFAHHRPDDLWRGGSEPKETYTHR
jgi:hypothetical protein